MIHVGFTGSQHGMSREAGRGLTNVLLDLYEASLFSSEPICLHHGDCIGSDKMASELAKYARYLVHAHPPFNDRKRAFSEANDIIHAPKDYIERNHDIVDVSRLIIATPHTMNEILRSGTWTTIRYARSLKREICIIYPDGSEVWENSDRPNKREASG